MCAEDVLTLVLGTSRDTSSIFNILPPPKLKDSNTQLDPQSILPNIYILSYCGGNACRNVQSGLKSKVEFRHIISYVLGKRYLWNTLRESFHICCFHLNLDIILVAKVQGDSGLTK